MNWIDIFCGSILLILTGIGIFCGLAKSIIHLIAWIGGAIGVIYAPEFLGPFLSNNFNFSETTLVILTQVFGFLVPFILLRILGHFINKFIKRHFSLLNALGGGFLGFIKGLIPCVILLSTLYILPLSGSLMSTRDSSFAYSAYRYALHKTGVSQKIQDTENSIRQSINDHISETMDSAKAKASAAAEEAVNHAAEKASTSAKETVKKAASKISE
ncbi:MAG: CvpA family protein [Fibrobacter sp.]|nr:CvpA family protein [Fibrobacter sp.]